MADVVPIARPTQNAPLDLDAEAAVLSAILIDPPRYDDIASSLRGYMFYSDANRRIFDVIVSLRESGTAIDLVTVASGLKSIDRLNQIGGTPYLAQISDKTPSIRNIQDHALIVREKWRLRQLIATCQRFAAEGYGDCEDVQALLEEAERLIGEIAYQTEAKELVPIRDPLDKAFAALQAMVERGALITGTPTGFKTLDEPTSGLHKGDLYIVAGRPGTGKTALAVGIAVNVAASGLGAAVFSLEMPEEQLVTRMLSSDTRIDLGLFRKPREIGKKIDEIIVSVAKLEKLPLWIDDTAAISVPEIRARVRRLKADIANKRTAMPVNDLVLVVIDYVQLVQGSPDSRSREQEVSSISRQLKQFAKEEQVAVIALSQLNRKVEERKGNDKRPQLSDLRETGALEQDADTVLFVYRPEMYSDEAEVKGIAEIIIGKQRNGPTGIYKLALAKECVRFAELEQSEFDEYDGFQNGLP